MHQSSGTLKIHDTRTSQDYLIPVNDNTIQTVDLRKIVTKEAKPLQLLDPGLQSTAAIRSEITFCGNNNNDQPTLEFRGFGFDQLRHTHDFESVAYLVLWGTIPSREAKQAFRDQLVLASMNVHPSVVQTIQTFSPEAPYLPMILAGLSAYLATNRETIPSLRGRNLYHGRIEALDEGCIRTIAAYHVALAAVHAHKTGYPFELKTNNNECIMVNLFRMMGIMQPLSPQQSRTLLHVLDQLWIIAVDHGMCNSTAALLHAASTMTDPISCFICAITSGSGILHFGGIDHAYRMLERIGKPANVYDVLSSMLAEGERIPGVGHRVYKVEDPRTKVMKELLLHLRGQGMTDPLLEVALEVDRQTWHNQELRKRKLCVNPDMYLSLIYTSLGIQAEAVMPLFLANRIFGMMAHWREAMMQPIKLWRPLAIFTGVRPDQDSALHDVAGHSDLGNGVEGKNQAVFPKTETPIRIPPKL